MTPLLPYLSFGQQGNMGICYALFLFASLIQITLSAVCKRPYTFSYRDSCYYIGYNPSLTFDEARIQCIMDGGHLVIFETRAEEDFIGTYLHKIHLNFPFYIDATDFRQEGYYYWEHTGKNLTYTNWNVHEPSGRMYENCVYKMEVTHKFKWIDINCFELAPYMCEKEEH